MYSEEEKIFLENIKNILSDLEDTEDGAIISLNQEEIDSLKSIPKLIEKQQKELDKIKALNIPIDTLVAEFERLENIEDDRDCNYISKDKIREKIEELEKEAFKSIAISEKINILKELLEENNND